MKEEQSPKSIAKSYTARIWGLKDLSAIDDFLIPDVPIYTVLGNSRGREFMKQVVQTWLTAFPDLIIEIEEYICDKDLVVIHWRAHGTHYGEFKGIKPTGRFINIAGVTIYRIKNEKIIEYWSYFDLKNILNQISS